MFDEEFIAVIKTIEAKSIFESGSHKSIRLVKYKPSALVRQGSTTEVFSYDSNLRNIRILDNPMSNNMMAATNPKAEYHGLSPNSPSSKTAVVSNAIKALKNNSKIDANSPFNDACFIDAKHN